MKLIKNLSNSNDDLYERFIITETEDRRIFRKFIDYETGYLIVLELNKLDKSDNRLYTNVINPQTGEIISPQERIKQINTTEQEIRDERLGLTLLSRRTVDEQTGSESLDERLLETATQRQILSGKSAAFDPEPRKNLIERHLEYLAEKRKSEEFWKNEYPQKTFEEKQAFWAQSIYRYMRWQGESGQDEFGVFTRENYLDWKAKEPQIDLILDFIIKRFPWEMTTQEAREFINKALGTSL
jgi:hypothetical protein